MADEQFSQFTSGTTPVDGDVAVGYLGASAGMAGANRKWTFSQIATYINTKISNAVVIAKVLTGYTSGAGVVAATDTILQAIQKLNGNAAVAAITSGTINTVVHGSANTYTGATMVAAGNTMVLKQGSNGKTGTVTLNGVTPVTVANSSITANSNIVFTLKTASGTVGAYPTIQTITPSTGFTVSGIALDVSIYNYAIIESAA